ncbi:MAG: N4-bis(aminopropyl)spermidine synthase [Clostridia bacterium]|nr:N4-bis(aminopropyl)spermidine synthase [Clostridia bacterium]
MIEKRNAKQILTSLLAGPKTFWRLIREQDGHLVHYVRLLEKLEGENLIDLDGGRIRLTEEGRALCQQQGLRPRQDTACPACGGRGLELKGIFGRALEEFREIARERPPALADFDQGHVDAASAVARAALIYARGDLENEDILILGDDDLTSIALALTGTESRITVLEADGRLVDFINRAAEKNGWKNLRARRYDVRDPLPGELRRKFGVFLIDPVETMPGITLFLYRCALGLRGKGAAGYIGLTHLEASREKWHAIQKLLLEMNFVITEIIHDFNEYELASEEFIEKFGAARPRWGKLCPPEVNWFTSNLVRVEAVEELKVPETAGAAGEEMFRDGTKFYCDEETFDALW